MAAFAVAMPRTFLVSVDRDPKYRVHMIGAKDLETPCGRPFDTFDPTTGKAAESWPGLVAGVTCYECARQLLIAFGKRTRESEREHIENKPIRQG